MPPIVANDEAPPEIPAEAYAKAEEMRALLNADLWEEEKARQVAAFEIGDLEMQLAVWLVLTTRERRAWREYFGIGYGMRIRQK